VLLIYFAPFFWQICSALVNPYSAYEHTFEEVRSTESQPPSHYLFVGHDHHHYSQFGFAPNVHQGALSPAQHINLFETCSYCSLLFHLNWIDVKPFELIALAKPTYPILFFATLSTRLHPRFSPLNPRAPPQRFHQN